jgi:hypothetical protein
MKKLILTTVIILTSVFSSFSQEVISNLKLSKYIDSLFQVDQQVIQDAINAYQRTASMDTFQLYEKIQNQTFERHIPFAKKIIKDFGYPTYEMIGKENSNNFFYLIQHSDKDVKFQAQALKLIKKQVDNKQAPEGRYAFLYDRVQLNLGKKQLYGTQVTYDDDGNAIPKNLKDKKNVNKRRLELNMTPIETYLNKMTEIHKKQNATK